jgi:cytochrome c oxidase subunit 2
MKHFAKSIGAKSIASGALLALAGAAHAAGDPVPWQLNMSPGVTETAQAAYEMHMIMLWICVVAGVLVFGAMAVAMFKFRKSKGAVPDVKWTHSTRMELVWTIIPVVILIVMAVPATKRLILMVDTRNAEMTVKVTGYQWKWRYEVVEYAKQPQTVNFMSTLAFEHNKTRFLGSGLDPAKVPHYLLEVDRPLVVPTNTKIRFLFTAEDVIHAWWVPAFGLKQDAIPGFINEGWTDVKEAGVYRGQCAELCGKDHGFMPIVVQAVPKAEFEQWLASNSKPPKDTAIAAAPVGPTAGATVGATEVATPAATAATPNAAN